MKLVSALAVAGLASVASAQPGSRNAIVYGARAVGETTWHSGTFSLDMLTGPTATIEIGIFAFRAQGVGMSGSAVKVYIDNVSEAGDSVMFRGTSGVSTDGRIGPYNFGGAVSKVFTNRNVNIPGSGFRLSTGTGGATGMGDTTDSATGGGITFIQIAPNVSTDFHTTDGDLVFRFDLTIARPVGPGAAREVTVHTPTSPLSRVNGYTTYNSLSAGSSTDFSPGSPNQPNVVVDSLVLSANWIPGPSALSTLVLAGAIGVRRRRHTLE